MNRNLENIKQRFNIIGNSKLLNHAIEVAIQVAPTDLSVLINGESGSGKESFSKIIHSLGKTKHGKFIAINCGAIPEGTIDSELFGHEKGAFTGAEEKRKGYFEEANDGTIFLDEIGEMPLATQSRLLRILEQGEYIRVGSSKIMKTNVRVIAATNVNLKDAINEKKFREDLYYRLNTVPIYVPPLRERKDDIHILFKKFALEFSEKYNIEPIRLNEEATSLLSEYEFPGNIRELKNIVNQISILEKTRLINKDLLEKYLPKNNNYQIRVISNHENQKSISEKELIYKALFEIKQDINDLRRLMLDILKNNDLHLGDIPAKEIEGLSSKIIDFTNVPSSFVSLSNKKALQLNGKELQGVEYNENLSIENKEKELVRKALVKHNHKRKLAAKELGISERTLYRKIKYYQLD